MHQPGAEAAARTSPADADHENLVATVTCELRRRPYQLWQPQRHRTWRHARLPSPSLPLRRKPALAVPLADPRLAQAHALVGAFYQRFYGVTAVTPHPKELAHALDLLTQHGAATAHFLVDFSHQAAPAKRGISHRPSWASATTYPGARGLRDTDHTGGGPAEGYATRRWQERYVQWRQETLAQLRAALPPAELAALEAEAHARLMAEGTPAYALGLRGWSSTPRWRRRPGCPPLRPGSRHRRQADAPRGI